MSHRWDGSRTSRRALAATVSGRAPDSTGSSPRRLSLPGSSGAEKDELRHIQHSLSLDVP